VRLIAATNAPLKELVKKKMFREDLYYRLNVINIEVPPLRDRKEDIPLLAHHFLDVYCKKNNRAITGITKDTMSILQEHNWPGNVRELENTIERAVILTKETAITPADLPSDILINLDKTENITISNKTLSIPLGKIPLKDIEKMVMAETLKQAGGNKNIASKILGVSARTLYRKMDE
jgi:DNA-binding NtrC family response regulator